jgi:hypothetical protein
VPMFAGTPQSQGANGSGVKSNAETTSFAAAALTWCRGDDKPGLARSCHSERVGVNSPEQDISWTSPFDGWRHDLHEFQGGPCFPTTIRLFIPT